MLLNDDLLPLFTRVSEKLFELVEGGWLPNRRGANPIQWHRRCWNKIADHLANHTMNAEKSWNQRFEPPGGWLDAKSVNFLIHTDGGTRADRCSAAAWHIEIHACVNGASVIFPLCMAGRFFTSPISSFTAEAIALEDALNFLHGLVHAPSAA